MQFLIASSLLVALGAYLLHQFWTRTLAEREDGGSPAEQEPAGAEMEPPERLKAA